MLDRYEHIEPIADVLQAIEPMPAAFDQRYVQAARRRQRQAGHEQAGARRAVREDIRDFKARHGCDRIVMIWCGIDRDLHRSPAPPHADLEAFEQAIDANDPTIAPSMLYAYAALMEGVPVRQRRAQPHGRHPGAGRSWRTSAACRSAARTSRPVRR